MYKVSSVFPLQMKKILLRKW